MPRGCRLPGWSEKARMYEVAVKVISTAIAEHRFHGDELAVAIYCAALSSHASFFPEERQHIALHLHQLVQRDDQTKALLAPLIELFPHDPVTTS